MVPSMASVMFHVPGRVQHVARREFTFDTIPLPDGPADAVDSPAADALASDAFFVAFDEYRVRETRGPGFEQAFAVRKSDLGLQDGFVFFALLRRVDPPHGFNKDATGEPMKYFDDVSYVAATVWETRAHYDDWGGQEWFGIPSRSPKTSWWSRGNLLGTVSQFVAEKNILKQSKMSNHLFQASLTLPCFFRLSHRIFPMYECHFPAQFDE